MNNENISRVVIKYPGAKNRIADWICSFIPKHDVYLEPFFGGGSIFFNKNQKAHIETINDLNDDVFNFFVTLRNQPEKLIRAIELTAYCRSEYEYAWKNSEGIDDVEKARRFAVKCYMSIGAGNRYKNGFRRGQQKTSPNPSKSWNEYPDVLQIACERLKGVQIENSDALELIKRYDTDDVFIYLDPPYLLSTRKGNMYHHEMSDNQHLRLLNEIVNHPAKIMISGYENDMYNSILKNWHKETKTTLAESAQKRTEVLWMNYFPENKLF